MSIGVVVIENDLLLTNSKPEALFKVQSSQNSLISKFMFYIANRIIIQKQ